MEKASPPVFSVSDFIAVTNQTLEYAYPAVQIEGEVASFKINQNKFVFFDLKDSGASVGCFMTVWQLRMPLEDGMKVIVRAVPKLTQWGKFSLTIQAIRPSGEGSLKKSFEILKAKLEAEGLFAPERKRPLPTIPTHIGVISSTAAAGYADFIKIINDRWVNLRIDVAHVQVQGESAPDQMIRALEYFNTLEIPPEIIVIIRGGGSADDLAAFNDEQLVRKIAASRVPTVVGVGHETDIQLADLVADVRAATPSNAAQIIVPDKHELIRRVHSSVAVLVPKLERAVDAISTLTSSMLEGALERALTRLDLLADTNTVQRRILQGFNPDAVLARGYAVIRGTAKVGETITIERSRDILEAEVRNVRQK